MRRSDVDLEAGRLSVRCALIPHGSGVIASQPKTARGGARSPLTRAASTPSRPKPRGSAMTTQAARQRDDQSEWGEAWSDSGYVFARENGEALHPQVTSRAFSQAVRAAKLPEIRLHDLRHTHATLALPAGIHPMLVSERLGHATGPITLDTCSHAIPALQEGEATSIADLVLVRS